MNRMKQKLNPVSTLVSWQYLDLMFKCQFKNRQQKHWS